MELVSHTADQAHGKAKGELEVRFEGLRLRDDRDRSLQADGNKEERGALYLGSFESSTSLDMLRAHSIHSIVHVLESCWTPTYLAHDPSSTLPKSEECYNYPIHFHSVPVPDSSSPQHGEAMFKALPEATEFIKEGLRRGNVLVHCFQGVSRSATVVIAFMMREKGWTYEEALKYVVGKRDGVKPNEGFVKILKKWEKDGAKEPWPQ
ncbi:phosphatases II [Atractiella rhizophila]|nr:phosphatases II [Atractiella rhizophila]